MHYILKKHLKQHITTSDEELERFCSLFEEKRVKKKEFLLHQGEICSNEIFVVNGLLRLFHINDKGEEQTLQFGVEEWWFTDLDSFFNQKPSLLNIQALEDSTILMLSYENRKVAEQELRFLPNLTQIMLQKSYTALQNRLIDNLSKTADQRYLDYIAKYPHIIKRLSNIEIASYLGVSPASLSRIKTQISLNKK